MNAAQIDLTADRQVDYVEKFSFIDKDYSGSAFKMMVRPTKDTFATPIVNLASGAGIDLTYAGTATVSAHISAGRLTVEIYTVTNPSTGNLFLAADTLLLSQVLVDIPVADLAATPFPAERGDDLLAWYDVIRFPAVGYEEIVMRGRFSIRAGVTIQ